MKVKQIMSIILIGTGAISLLAGCGADTKNMQPESTQQEIANTTRASAAESTETTETTAGKTLVVYYSATGSTENVANAIAQATGGDLLELEPAEPYSSADLDWTDDSSRVSEEYSNLEDRDTALLSETADNWESYDTVFIGYPIWWGIAAWPIDGFVKTNDFTGKTVVPFCTSSTSEIGESGDLLKEMAGTGEWLDGERFGSGVSQEDVQAWIQELGIPCRVA